MRPVKALGLALGLVVCTALAAIAFGGVSSASGGPIFIESCMAKNNSECKPSTIGATLVSTGKVELSNAFFTHTCDSEFEEKVIDNEMVEEKGEAAMAMTEISSFKLSNCSGGGELLIEETPWRKLKGWFLWIIGTYSWSREIRYTWHESEKSSCTFEEDATHKISASWTNGKPSETELFGSLAKVEGGSSCGSSVNLSGTYKVASVKDPELPETGNIQVL